MVSDGGGEQAAAVHRLAFPMTALEEMACERLKGCEQLPAIRNFIKGAFQPGAMEGLLTVQGSRECWRS